MKKSNMARGWITAVATMLTVMLTVLPLNTISIFLRPMCESLGITTAEISVCFSLNAVGSVLTALFYGRLVKRFGKKPLIAVGGFTVFLYLFTMAVSTNKYLFYITAVVAGFGGTTSGFAMGNLTMTEWFDKGRGTMFSSLTITLSLFVAICSPIFASGIERFGYQPVLLVESIVCGGGIILMGLFLISDTPEKYGMLPIGYVPPVETSDAGAQTSLTMAQIKRTLPFFIALLISMLSCTVGRVATTHGNNFFRSLGLTSIEASYVSSANAIATLVWSAIFGIMVDKFSPKVAAVATGCCAAAVMLLNPYLAGLSGALLYAIFVEAESGIAATYSPAMMTKIYGKKEAASVIGLVRCFASVGSIIGPTVAGVLYDKYNSYNVCLTVTGILMSVVVLLVFALDNKKVIAQVERLKQNG